jgi:hypothetical protein
MEFAGIALLLIFLGIVSSLCYNTLMTVENFQQILTALANRRPFKPFLVEIHGGRRFEVDYPTALNFRDGVAVFIAPGGVPILFDHESVVAILGDIAEASA